VAKLRSRVSRTAKVVIAAIFLLLALWVFRPRPDDVMKTKIAQEQCNRFSVALDMFAADCGRYPSSQEALGVLWERQPDIRGWNGPYLDPPQKPTGYLDPWGQFYTYRVDRDGTFVSSAGPDMRAGSGDDVRVRVGVVIGVTHYRAVKRPESKEVPKATKLTE
jgi:hypothetical protein